MVDEIDGQPDQSFCIVTKLWNENNGYFFT